MSTLRPGRCEPSRRRPVGSETFSSVLDGWKLAELRENVLAALSNQLL